MRVKPVPEPPEDPAAVERARAAVPLVPGTEADCCARLADRLDVPREEARVWLTFLRGLGLAEPTDDGFVRTDADPDLGDAILEGVFGAEEVLAALADANEPLDTGAVFERVEDVVPEWERHKHPGAWRAEWRERVERLLGWLVLAGLAERVEGGYVR